MTTRLATALSSGKEKIVASLIKEGADPTQHLKNAFQAATKFNNKKLLKPLLFWAADNGNLNMLKEFFQKKIDMHAVDEKGNTIIHRLIASSKVSEKQKIKYIQQLCVMEKKMQFSGEPWLHGKNNDGKLPVECARTKSNDLWKDIGKIYVKTLSKDGELPLLKAIKNKESNKTLKEFIQQWLVDPFVKNKNSNSAIIEILKTKQFELLPVLLCKDCCVKKDIAFKKLKKILANWTTTKNYLQQLWYESNEPAEFEKALISLQENLEKSKLFYKNTANLLLKPYLRKQDTHGMTLLHHAAAFSNSEKLIEAIIMSGNAKQKNTTTTTTTSSLQEKSIESIRDKKGRRAIFLAQKFQNKSALITLTKHKMQKYESDEVVGLREIQDELENLVKEFKNPHPLLNKPSGILLAGPPGVGKTMLARSIAKKCNCTFETVKLSDYASPYIFEAPRKLQKMFDRIRQTGKTTILFFDEIDSIGSKRNYSSSNGDRSRADLVNVLLAQMDGFGKSKNNILIMGATNFVEVIDAALTRPGRFSHIVRIGKPTKNDRLEMRGS